MHSIWDLWISGFQERKGNGFFKVGQVDNNFQLGLENLYFPGWVAAPVMPPAWDLCREWGQTKAKVEAPKTDQIREFALNWGE